MSTFKLTQFQYLLKSNVEYFGNIIYQFEEQHLTHISTIIWNLIGSINIDYLVFGY